MKKKYLLLLTIISIILFTNGCGKDKVPNQEQELVETIVNGEIYIKIPELPEHTEYQVSAVDYNRLQAADNLIVFGEQDSEPLLYIGQYEGIEDKSSNYKMERFLRGTKDSYIFETDEYRMEVYLVPEKYLSDYICMTKSAINYYMKNGEGFDEKTKSFMSYLSDNIKLGNMPVTFNVEKTSPYLQNNSKLFFEYIETTAQEDEITNKRYLPSLCSCTSLGNDNYLVIRTYKLQQTDPIYNEMIEKYIPKTDILEIYMGDMSIFKEEAFREWVNNTFPYGNIKQFHSLETQLNNFILRVIPSNIYDASPEELEEAEKTLKEYYMNKFSN